MRRRDILKGIPLVLAWFALPAVNHPPGGEQNLAANNIEDDVGGFLVPVEYHKDLLRSTPLWGGVSFRYTISPWDWDLER